MYSLIILKSSLAPLCKTEIQFPSSPKHKTKFNSEGGFDTRRSTGASPRTPGSGGSLKIGRKSAERSKSPFRSFRWKRGTSRAIEFDDDEGKLKHTQETDFKATDLVMKQEKKLLLGEKSVSEIVGDLVSYFKLTHISIFIFRIDKSQNNHVKWKIKNHKNNRISSECVAILLLTCMQIAQKTFLSIFLLNKKNHFPPIGVDRKISNMTFISRFC